MKFLLSFVIKPVNWPSTTPTTDNKAGSAREGLISPSIVRLEELELAMSTNALQAKMPGPVCSEEI